MNHLYICRYGSFPSLGHGLRRPAGPQTFWEAAADESRHKIGWRRSFMTPPFCPPLIGPTLVDLRALSEPAALTSPRRPSLILLDILLKDFARLDVFPVSPLSFLLQAGKHEGLSPLASPSSPPSPFPLLFLSNNLPPPPPSPFWPAQY